MKYKKDLENNDNKVCKYPEDVFNILNISLIKTHCFDNDLEHI